MMKDMSYGSSLFPRTFNIRPPQHKMSLYHLRGVVSGRLRLREFKYQDGQEYQVHTEGGRTAKYAIILLYYIFFKALFNISVFFSNRL